MRRILIFSLNYYPRFIGGAEVAIKEITDRIDPTAIEFHMVTLRLDASLPKEETIGNVHVHRIGMVRPNPSIADLQRFPLKTTKYWYQFGAYFAALRLQKIHRFDGIWAMMAHSSGIPAGLFKKRYPNVRYLLTLQEGDPPEHIEKLARPVWPLFTAGFTRADALQSISTFLDAWGKRMGFTGHAEVIPNAVDVARFSAPVSEDTRRLMQTELDKKEGDVFLVTTSRLVHKNGIDNVIRAVPLLPPHISFLVYGIGPDEEKLRSLAYELGVSERVRFMGQIDHERMPTMLSACDIFIRPSRSEGMGNSFIEAMAAGLPVIATQEGGLKDFLFDAEKNPTQETTGWAVGSEDPEDIKHAVLMILADPEKTRRVTQTAQALVARSYDWQIVARQMRVLFDRMFAAG